MHYNQINQWNKAQRPLWPFAINWASPQANGLVSCWPFVPFSASQNAVTEVLIDIARQHQGVFTTGPGGEFVSDAELGGAAYDFDGTDDEVNCGEGNGDFDFSNAITIAMWVKHTSQNVVYLAKRDNVTASYEISHGTGAQGLIFRKGTTGATTVTLLTNFDVSDDLWHHIAATWTDVDDTMRAYVDGVEVDTLVNSVVIQASNVDLTIARRVFPASPGFYGGLIADARVYSRALDASVIAQMAAPETRWALYQPRRGAVPLAFEGPAVVVVPLSGKRNRAADALPGTLKVIGY